MMSEVRDTANRVYRICKRYKGDEEQKNWLFGFLACAVLIGEISEDEVCEALKRL